MKGEMQTSATDTAACPLCGQAGVARLFVGGLCPACAARGAGTSLLGLLEESAPPSLEKPEMEGYAVHELIGGGGMGEVWRAARAADGATVALKLVAARLTRDPEVTARFESEVAALTRMDHPNVVRVLDHGVTRDDRHYLATEYVDGCDLRRLMRAQRLPPERVFEIFQKVCAGVSHAHERGMVHRDLKPGNILTGADGTVKVADFGLAKALADDSDWHGLTQTQDRFGTPYYIAPEVLRAAGSADQRSDVFALGVLFYEMMSGQVPLGRYTPLSALAGLDRRVDAIVQHALENDPARRESSVDRLAAAVADVEKRWRRGLRRGRRSRLAFAALLLLGGGLTAGAWWAGKKTQVSFPSPANATRAQPWINSLGMRFVPVPDGGGLLASVWETRVRDYAAFAEAENAMLPEWRSEFDSKPPLRNDRPAHPAARDNPGWKPPTWDAPHFEQSPDHPVCGINLPDARLFCAWLTWKERQEGRISAAQRYRLPTDHEWNLLTGLGEREFPLGLHLERILESEENMSRGNFAGQEVYDIPGWFEHVPVLPHRDPFPRTAPVGSFPPNALGLYDLLGNVMEWTDTPGPPRQGTGTHILRGGGWASGMPSNLLWETPHFTIPVSRPPTHGFRVLLESDFTPAPPSSLDELEP